VTLRDAWALLNGRLRGFPPAYRTVLNVPLFTEDGIGAAGITPPHLTAAA
jgi:hypothetical protein